MKYLIPFATGLFLLFTACQDPDWNEDAIPVVASPEHTWQLTFTGWNDPTILQLSVGENELRVLARTTLTRVDARGQRIQGTIRSYHYVDLFTRPVFSHQFFLHKNSQTDHYFWMEVADWGFTIDGNRFSDARVYSVIQPPAGDTSYSAFLHGAEPAAVNVWGEFLVPAVRKDLPGRVTLVLVDPYKWFPFDGTFPNARQWEVTLPQEAGTQMVRLSGLGDDFLVSTREATYLVRRTGTLTPLWSAGATHAFSLGNTWYAELESELYRSTDKGVSWQQVGPGAGRLGTGDYYVLDSTVVYAREDSLYRVDTGSGDLEPLNNKGLEGNQITSLALFTDKVYVGTLTGLFTKPRHALLR